MGGLASAADADDSIQTHTSDSSTSNIATDNPQNIEVKKNINNEDRVNHEDCNVPSSNENNNIESQNNSQDNEQVNNNFERDTNPLWKKIP